MGPNFDIVSLVGPELRPEWSQALVMDVALGVKKELILETYGFADHQYDQICRDLVFVASVERLRKDLEKEGATFRLKCQLQADHYLQDIHTMIKDTEGDPRVRLRAVEDVVRWAGLDAPAQISGEGGGAFGGFSISINLGSSQRSGITIDGDAS